MLSQSIFWLAQYCKKYTMLWTSIRRIRGGRNNDDRKHYLIPRKAAISSVLLRFPILKRAQLKRQQYMFVPFIWWLYHTFAHILTRMSWKDRTYGFPGGQILLLRLVWIYHSTSSNSMLPSFFHDHIFGLLYKYTANNTYFFVVRVGVATTWLRHFKFKLRNMCHCWRKRHE